MVPAQHPPATSAVGPAENYISTPLIPSLRILGVSSQPAGLSSANHRSCRLLEELVEEVLLCFVPATLRACRFRELHTACRDGATSSTALPSAAGSGSYTARPHMLGFFCKGGMKSYLVRTSSTASARSSTPTTYWCVLLCIVHEKNHGLRLHCLGSFAVTGSQLECSLCSAPPG